VGRTPTERILKNVFKNIQEGKRSVRKPRKRWLDDVENDLKEITFGGWRKLARDSDACKLMLMEARLLHGLYSQWKNILHPH
jgi:hypothetical protein